MCIKLKLFQRGIVGNYFRLVFNDGLHWEAYWFLHFFIFRFYRGLFFPRPAGQADSNSVLH